MVIPTYNERDGLAELVHALFDAASAGGLALAVVIVDDNSPDGTGQLADDLARTYPLHVVHRTGKLGLGSAVMAGIEVARTDVIGVMDADFSHPPAFVPALLDAFHRTQADVVIASRYVAGGSTSGWPWPRRLLSRAGCLLARPLSPIRDPASGFFLIKRSIAQRAPIKAGGFKICLELVMRGWPVRLVEIPYRFDERRRGKSKMTIREGVSYLLQLKDLYLMRLFGGGRPRREYITAPRSERPTA